MKSASSASESSLQRGTYSLVWKGSSSSTETDLPSKESEAHANHQPSFALNAPRAAVSTHAAVSLSPQPEAALRALSNKIVFPSRKAQFLE